jgi:hypothetical protein
MGAAAAADDAESNGDDDGDVNDDYGAAGCRQLDADLDAAGAMQRSFAADFLQLFEDSNGAGASLQHVYKYDICALWSDQQAHSRRECIALARVLDAARRQDWPTVLEMLCRRLAGVQTAVDTGNWAMCEQLEHATQQRSFVPARVLAAALKNVSRVEAIKKAGGGASYGRGGSAAGRGGSRGGTRGGRSGGGGGSSAGAGDSNGAAGSQQAKPSGSKKK